MRHSTMMTLLILGIIVLAMLNLAVGSVAIPVNAVLTILNPFSDKALQGANAEVWTNIIIYTRLPPTITAMACGAGLSVAGLEMQTVFRNPLAGPSVLGISSAASLGVAFVVLLSGAIGGTALSSFGIIGNTAITIAAIFGAMLVMSLIVFLSHKVEGNVTLLITGVLIGYIATAIIGVLKYFSSEEDIRAYVIWGLGSFSRVTGGQVYVFTGLTAFLLPFVMLLAKPLNILLLGDLYATNLGLNVKRARMLTIASAGTLTAIVTAYCGPIMFLGLAVPHICRGLFNTTDHNILLPANVLCGAALALLCNFIARMPGFEGALPINSVTSLIGAPIALSILLKKKRNLI